MINILFVCSGDTCRSAMAEAITKKQLCTKKIKNIFVDSAGLFATDGAEMSDNAKIALKNMNIKVGRHKAKQLTNDILNKFDYVFTMTKDQQKIIKESYIVNGSVISIAEVNGGEDIADPYGKSASVYYNTARQLSFCIEKILNKIILIGEKRW